MKHFRNEQGEVIEVQIAIAQNGSKQVHFHNLDTDEVWYEEYQGETDAEAIENAIRYYAV